MKIHAVWTDDCGGKKDYDCDLISLSTRYWPQGGGFFVLDSTGFHGNEARPEIKPSAKASLRLGDLCNGPYIDLISEEFEGDTEAEVKAKVEEWAQSEYEKLIALVSSHYGVKP